MENILPPALSCRPSSAPIGAAVHAGTGNPQESSGAGNPAAHLSPPTQTALFNYLCWLGDDRVILGTRLSEWCGHGPVLEEDIALANIALDLIGQSSAFLSLAGLIEGKNRSEDALAYLRTEREYCCSHIVELPRGDYAFTIIRHLIFSAFSQVLFTELAKSSFADLRARAAKALVEVRYHVEHARSWTLRLGNGTEESHQRMISALTQISKFVPDLLNSHLNDEVLVTQGIVPDLLKIRPEIYSLINTTLREATLPELSAEAVVSPALVKYSGRAGIHTEHLGKLLAEMQYLVRTYPGATW